ncbi:MAG TPA: sortase [Actinomycetota bacterium]|nr:sortase [Actinomycetota bacterium]
MVFIRVFGKFLISVGVGVLLFVAWTLWGTGIYTAQQQDRLEAEFGALPELKPGDEGPGLPPDDFEPGPGVPIFRMTIPSIDLRKMVIEGVGVEELKLGPGHYPSCRAGFEAPLCTPFDAVFPGEKGRVIVSGHRTTYGQPFWDLDRLKRGDTIDIDTRWGEFTYRVTKTEVVPPDSRAIVVQSDKAELVLTTCNPKFSAAERLIVYAELER